MVHALERRDIIFHGEGVGNEVYFDAVRNKLKEMVEEKYILTNTYNEKK